ncbi:IS5 family transposase [Paraflavisolibacter sp. H34]|uniref:IS5 family transposase n=1 Tax=Huijunlia imazamoxiresistens TaxID=3127457 RepID=UPI0030193614
MAKKQSGLFDEEFKLNRISQLGDPLEKLDACIDWKIFRPILNKALEKEPKGPGGRPPFDYVLMFKILILQEYFGLSDEQMEFQITDRFSFMRFLGLRTCSKVPDQNTIWHFRKQLKKDDTVRKLFERFHKELKNKNLIVNKGKIIDASIVEVPVQRNSREENDQVKGGDIPEEWDEKKRSHKDTDARWVKKGNENYFGYKNHVKVDAKKKFVDDYGVSDAAVHDSVKGADLLSKKDEDQTLHADSAYTGETFEKAVEAAGMINKIHEKGYRDHPLTPKQKRSNRAKSRVRVRVELVFGFLHQATGGVLIRTIGRARAEVKIGLMNLTYHLFRYTLYSKPKRA